MARLKRSRLLDLAGLAMAGAGAVGLVVRLTVRDGWPLAANLFYVLPTLMIAVLFGLASVVWWVNRRRVTALVCAGLTLLMSGVWGRDAAYFGRGCEPSPASFRVLLWNTARGVAGWPRVAEQMARADPDLIGLVEAGGSGEDAKAFWLARFPQHEAYMAGAGMVILVRGRIVEHRTLPVAGTSRCAVVEAEVRGSRLRVVVLDAIVRPFSDRREVVRQVFELARSASAVPTIVMGDFNTPVDSVWFEDPRGEYVHAFEFAGRGMLGTWPVPLPVLAIDHIWVSRGLDVRCARIGWSWFSDHRPMMADLSFTGTNDR
ncbi:MAG TPA: endonuclease/exonuclease/phosphatase family protein [Candidatus Polarisedimenticolaceae bacterium]|nr:endonuclease/exonuclease/phosphatase family protein [Candidatus Polarisedimenticolaceae bacterium]